MKDQTRDWTEWHVAAAAESEFAPGDLAESPDDVGPIVAALQNDIAVVPTKAGPRWTLKRDVRQAVLNDRQDEVTRQAQGDGPLHQVLRGEDPGLEALDAVALTAYLDASWTVQGTPFARPDAAQRARALLGRRKILEPFQRLIGGHFRGRESELGQLASLVAASNDHKGLESYVPEVATKAVRSLLGRRSRVLLLHGPGGVGKSSLLAKFLLDHAEDDTLPFAFIDFDIPSISPTTPTTLLTVAARQLGMQYAPLGPTVDRFIERGSPTVEGFLALFDGESDGLEAATNPADWGPFLLVLDTFEEAEFRSNGALGPLWQTLDTLMDGHPGLRIVLSGRSRPPIPWEPWADLHLEGFDPDSATGFLVHRGVPAELAPKIARRLGGNPLTLSLAASLAASGLETEIETRGRFWLRLDETAIQGQLVTRILDHIHDERARKLAHPGMVLRRVNPAVIQHVLAGPCGIEVRNEADAAELFAILERETALVRNTSDGALEHRRDVRSVMLDQLLKSAPQKATAIRHAFIEWSETDGPQSARWRAEELFHRYWLAHGDDAIEARWMKGVEDHLEDALAELPIRQRVRLAKRIGVPVSRDDLQHADLAHWEEETATFLGLQLQQGSGPGSLLGVLQERTERTRRSPLAAIEARLLLDSGSSEAAEAVVDRALEEGHDDDAMLRVAERVYGSVDRLEDAQAMAEARSSR